MDSIISVVGRQILDSRGNPTVEVDVTLADGSFGRACLLYTSPSPRDKRQSRMPSSA